MSEQPSDNDDFLPRGYRKEREGIIRELRAMHCVALAMKQDMRLTKHYNWIKKRQDGGVLPFIDIPSV